MFWASMFMSGLARRWPSTSIKVRFWPMPRNEMREAPSPPSSVGLATPPPLLLFCGLVALPEKLGRACITLPRVGLPLFASVWRSSVTTGLAVSVSTRRSSEPVTTIVSSDWLFWSVLLSAGCACAEPSASAATALNAPDASPTDRAIRTAKDKEFRLLCMITPNDSGGAVARSDPRRELQLKFALGDERYADRKTPAKREDHRENLNGEFSELRETKTDALRRPVDRCL